MPKISENQPHYVKKYTEDDIQKALQAVHDGMSKKMAAKKFNVPRSTIQFRLSNDFVKTRPGPSTVLSEHEENQLEEWLILSSRKGFPKRKDDVLDSVQEFLKKNPRDSSFVDMRPGKGWYRLFLQRHPALSLRQSEGVTSSSSKISETDIRKWFEQIMVYLKEMKYDDILQDPSRVFNGDETGFLFNPKDSKVIAPKGDKNVYEIEHAPSKTSLTVMFTFSANGTLTPPMVVFPLKRMRKEILQSVPESWGVGMSENGWMKSETFFNYIKNVLYPFLVTNGTKFPIILFLDGHKSHTTLELSQLCQSVDIILISLYPNATRLLQPADVAAFRPIKSAWRKAVLDWRKKNLTKTLTKVDFGPILENVINNHINPNILINGFRACGLVPWNPNAVDYSKCLGTQRAHFEKTTVSTIPNLSFSKFQEIIGPVVMRRLENDNIGKSGEAKALQKIHKYFFAVNEASQDIEYEEYENVDVIEDKGISQEAELITDESINYHQNEDTERHVSIYKEMIPIADMPIFPEDDVMVHTNVEVSTSAENIISPVQPKNSGFTSNEFTSLPSCSFWSEIKEKTPEKQPTTLKEILVLPKTPIRNSKVKSVKQPFVLTSRGWQNIELDKLEKKNKILLEKENRKRKREEKSKEKIEAAKKKEEDKKKKASLIKRTKNIPHKHTFTTDSTEKLLLNPVEGKIKKEEQKTLKQVVNTKPIILSNILLKPKDRKIIKKEQSTLKPLILKNILVKPRNQKEEEVKSKEKSYKIIVQPINQKEEKENSKDNPCKIIMKPKEEKEKEKPLKCLSSEDIRRILEEE